MSADSAMSAPARLLEAYALPSFSGVVTTALERARDPDADAGQVATVLEADPGVTVKLLSLANSSAYGLAARVNSAGHAIALLGREQVEALLLSVAVAGLLPKSPLPELDPMRFWLGAARRASVAKALAMTDRDARRAGECFTAALLQDMAVPLIAQVEGSAYGAVLAAWRSEGRDLAVLEREAFGYDHAELGALMCRTWHFAEAVTQAVAQHHAATPETPKSPVQAVAHMTDADNDYGASEVIAHAVDVLGLLEAEAEALVQDSATAAVEVARLFA